MGGRRDRNMKSSSIYRSRRRSSSLGSRKITIGAMIINQGLSRTRWKDNRLNPKLKGSRRMYSRSTIKGSYSKVIHRRNKINKGNNTRLSNRGSKPNRRVKVSHKQTSVVFSRIRLKVDTSLTMIKSQFCKKRGNGNKQFLSKGRSARNLSK